jgi:hypothetical protein
MINGQRFEVALVENAVLGGVASVAGGGKFANGAITGAFGYMYNAMGGRIVGGIIGGLLEGVAGLEMGPGDALIIAHGIYTWGEIGSRIEDWARGASGPETIVIGEDMAGRVIPTAQSLGANVYSPPDAPPDQWMQNNQNWINQKMDEGCTILDCGAAAGRANFPNATSPYYQMEQNQIQQRAYPNYRKIPALGE